MTRRTDLQRLFDAIPENGEPIGNVTLQKKMRWSDEKYGILRKQLLDAGRISTGRGKGGSVFRIQNIKMDRNALREPPAFAQKYRKERDLYEDFQREIAERYTLVYDIGKRFVCPITASQGKKATGGRWTRPDVSLIAVRGYTYVPGKFLDIITFEIKHYSGFEVTGVFETAAHSKFATKSYLAAYLPEGWDIQKQDHLRVYEECERFGMGLIYFTNPADYGSYEVLVEPQRRSPDPADMDEFLRTQLRDSEKEILGQYLEELPLSTTRSQS